MGTGLVPIWFLGLDERPPKIEQTHMITFVISYPKPIHLLTYTKRPTSGRMVTVPKTGAAAAMHSLPYRGATGRVVQGAGAGLQRLVGEGLGWVQ